MLLCYSEKVAQVKDFICKSFKNPKDALVKLFLDGKFIKFLLIIFHFFTSLIFHDKFLSSDGVEYFSSIFSL